MSITETKLEKVASLIAEGLNAERTLTIFDIIGLKDFTAEELKEYRLWGDYLPVGVEEPYTDEQRYLHILWESIDRSPVGINVDFAIPFRQIIAKKLFKRCGKGFIANEGCRFNYGPKIEVGDYVCWNHCSYIDSKGGVVFNDYSMITEYTKIFTHGHSESDHEVRTYSPVVLGEYVKVYTACTILPGVTMGKGSIAATGSIVTKSVPEMTVVAGIPAKPMRLRRTEGKPESEFNHYMFLNKDFQ